MDGCYRRLARPGQFWLVKPIEADLFSVQAATIDAPALPLVVFVAVQTAAGDPFAVLENAFVDAPDADLAVVLIDWAEGDAEPFAGADEAIRAVSQDETVAGVGAMTKDLVQGDVDGVAVGREIDGGVGFVEHETAGVAGGLMLGENRGERCQFAVAGGEVAVRIGVVLD